ncbi:MAG: hypothetical protein AAFY28_03105 [Actinomycetota bacterium]
MRRRTALIVAVAVVAVLAVVGVAATVDDSVAAATTYDSIGGGEGSERFGAEVQVLTNGNYVVVDPHFDTSVRDVGAVFLYDGRTDELISTLTGSTEFDYVGEGGITALANGDFVVASPRWAHGGMSSVGAVTLVDGATGLNGVVNPANSLHGTTANDLVGNSSVTELSDGDVVVASENWDLGGVINAGAVTRVAASGGTSGPVTTQNSLFGTRQADFVGGDSVVALPNGGYVVSSPSWDSAASENTGAVTYVGPLGLAGAVGEHNSLHGTSSHDGVGADGVVVLTNGNYVVRSPYWNNGSVTAAGAATFGSGTHGVSGPVSTTNSLHGTTHLDQVSRHGVGALANGDYVVASGYWDHDDTVDVGAATFADGTTGIVGPVTSANSLHGTTAADHVGSGRVTALANGDYVVVSRLWDLPGAENVGAVTLGDGTTGITGPVTVGNSLHGTQAGDLVGAGGVTELTNGDYVVTSHLWDNAGGVDVGAVTVVDGTTGSPGPVTRDNSLHGRLKDDMVGSRGVVALGDGFLVASPNWDEGGIPNAGAVTPSGPAGVVGSVTAENSVIGMTPNDAVGSGGMVPVEGGGATVTSPSWDGAGTPDGGAVTYFPPSGDVDVIDATTSAIGDPPGYVDQPGERLTSGRAIVIPSSQNRVLLLRLAPLDDPDPSPAPVPRPPPVAPPPPDPTGMVLFAPGRLLDTRPDQPTIDGVGAGIGRRSATQETVIEVAGRHGIPTDAAAAIFNVAAVDPSDRGYVSLYPCDATRPGTSTVNFAAGQTTANGAVVRLSEQGTVCAYAHRATDLILDVSGYAPPDSVVSAIVPARLVETRHGEPTSDGQQEAIGRRQRGQRTVVQVAGRAQVPQGAPAAFVNVAAVEPADRGFATVYPCDGERPGASMLNYAAGQTVANMAMVGLSDEGTACVYTHRSMDLIVDVIGVVDEAQAVLPVPPARLFETRTGEPTVDGRQAGVGAVEARHERVVQVTGRAGIPENATGAMVNVAALDPSDQGFLTLYPCGAPQPNASTLNYGAGQRVANGAIVALSDRGELCVYSHRATDVIVDVTGYVVG